MDAAVLAVQRWVNTTYTGVSGYEPIAEDGSAGRQTMAALTRGLQHELGITALADNFGPGTLAALTAHGPIGPTEANRNIVKIVQGGLSTSARSAPTRKPSRRRSSTRCARTRTSSWSASCATWRPPRPH